MGKKDNKKKTQITGRRWNQAGVFPTYEEADAKRKKIAEDENTQAKVRYRNASNFYTVHYRKVLPTEEAKGKKGKKVTEG
jgi:hypothetical protein